MKDLEIIQISEQATNTYKSVDTQKKSASKSINKRAHVGLLYSQESLDFSKAEAKLRTYKDKGIDAAYIIAPLSVPHKYVLYYVDGNTLRSVNFSLKDEASTKQYFEKLGCLTAYENREEAGVTCLCEQLNQQQLDSLKLDLTVNVLQKFDALYEYSDKNQNLYKEAIETYHAFIKVFLKQFLEGLKIHLGYESYKLEALTLATRGDLFNKNYQGNLVTFLSVNTKKSEADIRQLLDSEKARNVLNTLIPNPAHQLGLLQGLTKLDHLLSKPRPRFAERAFESLVVDYDAEYKPGRNTLVDFLLTTMEVTVGKTQAQIKEEIKLKGSSQEQQTIAALKQECKLYIRALEKHAIAGNKEVSSNAPHIKTPLLETQKQEKVLTQEASTKAEKLRKINELLNILNSEYSSGSEAGSASQKILGFRKTLNASKTLLTKDNDTAGWLFLERSAYILGSLLLGAGLIYSYATKGTVNFFKSADDIRMDKLNAILGKIETSVPYEPG